MVVIVISWCRSQRIVFMAVLISSVAVAVTVIMSSWKEKEWKKHMVSKCVDRETRIILSSRRTRMGELFIGKMRWGSVGFKVILWSVTSWRCPRFWLLQVDWLVVRCTLIRRFYDADVGHISIPWPLYAIFDLHWWNIRMTLNCVIVTNTTWSLSNIYVIFRCNAIAFLFNAFWEIVHLSTKQQ